MWCFLCCSVKVDCVLGEKGSLLGESLLRFEGVGTGPCRNLGERSTVENLGERGVGLLESCSPSSERHTVAPGLGPNGFILPVLKHGPRSLIYVRVCA